MEWEEMDMVVGAAQSLFLKGMFVLHLLYILVTNGTMYYGVAKDIRVPLKRYIPIIKSTNTLRLHIAQESVPTRV
jgi:hypothetical protein